MAMQWTYGLALMSMTSGGVEVHSWKPSALVGGSVGPPTYELIQEEIELIGFERDPWIYGYRAILPVVLEMASGGAGTLAGEDSLELVLSDLVSGSNYLNVSVDNGASYKRCNLRSFDQSKIDEKNNALRIEMEFEARALQALPNPPGVSGGW